MAAIWNYDVQVLPVLLALLLFEIPNWIRRSTGFFYVPIYFPIFPLRELNRDLALYLKEDYWLGEDQSDEEAEGLRRRLILRSIGSIALAAVAIPALAGFLGSFFLTRETLAQFLVVLVAYKLVGITRAIRDFHQHARGSARNRLLLSVIYFLYLGVMVQMVRAAYLWAAPFVARGEWAGLASAVSDLIFGKAIAQGIILAALTAVFVSLLADRKVRQENIGARHAAMEEPLLEADVHELEAPRE